MMQKIQDVNDGRVELLPWTSSEATQGRNVHIPNEVHSRPTQKVWDEGRKARLDANGNRQTLGPRQGR
jgi:hypothetical protein